MRQPQLASVISLEIVAQSFHFANGDERNEADEEQEQQTELTETAEEETEIDPRRPVQVPARRQKAAIERRDDDDETLEPHADENRGAGGEENAHARSESLPPEDLRHDHVAGDHDPVEHGIRAARSLDEMREALARI